MGSLDYFEISEEEALDLALNNTMGIVEITTEEDEETNYEETRHMMENSSISFDDL